MQMNENYAKLRNYCVSVVPMYPLMSYIIFSGTGTQQNILTFKISKKDAFLVVISRFFKPVSMVTSCKQSVKWHYLSLKAISLCEKRCKLKN